MIITCVVCGADCETGIPLNFADFTLICQSCGEGLTITCVSRTFKEPEMTRYNIMNGEKVAGHLDMFEGAEVYSLADYSADCIRTESLLPEVTFSEGDADVVQQIIETCQTADGLKRKVFYKPYEDGPKSDKALNGPDCRLFHGAIGCITEGGELIEALMSGKHDDVNIMEEVGDLMWYIGILLDEVSSRGHAIPDVLKTNIAKLRKRYPDKFDSEAALNRDLKGERDVLEGKGITIK